MKSSWPAQMSATHNTNEKPNRNAQQSIRAHPKTYSSVGRVTTASPCKSKKKKQVKAHRRTRCKLARPNDWKSPRLQKKKKMAPDASGAAILPAEKKNHMSIPKHADRHQYLVDPNTILLLQRKSMNTRTLKIENELKK